MKNLTLRASLVSLLIMSTPPLLLAPTEGCTPAQVKTVNTIANDVISFAQYSCIMASPLLTSPQLAVACAIVTDVANASPALLDFLDKLIGQRESLKRAGYAYDGVKWNKP